MNKRKQVERKLMMKRERNIKNYRKINKNRNSHQGGNMIETQEEYRINKFDDLIVQINET